MTDERKRGADDSGGASRVYRTGFGDVTITADGEAVTGIRFGAPEDRPGSRGNGLTDLAAEQLVEYFEGKRLEFTVPLRPEGTEFQLRVWSALREIPYGQTWSYRQLAERIGRPTAVRAVGSANAKNPIWIMLPCHRVIGADGSLVGYGGGLPLKQRLLELEKKTERKPAEA